jgi:hypothetical protein
MVDRPQDSGARQSHILAEHGEAIARIETRLDSLEAKIDKLVAMVERHETILNEYTGARKILHWIVVAVGAVGGYIFGKGHPP